MKRDLYQVPSHRYDFAGFMNKLGGNPVDGKLTTGAFAGMNADLAGALPALGSAVGGVTGGLIGGGRTSAAGDVIGGLSKMASAIPGPWGAIAGAGLGVIGGLTNAAFGVKLNQENINAVNNNINSMNSFQSNASSFDALAQNINSQPTAMDFNQKFIGKNGWFNKGATRKYNQLLAQQDAAQQFVDNSIDNNMMNLVNTQNQNLLANYAAEGGPLATNGADWSTGLTYIGAGGSHEQNPNGGVQQGIAPDGQPNLVEEGEVIWNNDYVFSKRLKVPKAIRNKYKLGGPKPISFADAALQFNKEMEERPNDPISKRGRDSMLAKLADVQEEKRADIALKEQQEDILQGIQPMIAANGGAIHIDKNKRGTFTAAASRHGKSVQEFASQVLANPENYSPAMRKKANFARNAAKWHSNGGHLFLPGGNLAWPRVSFETYPYRENDDRYDGRLLPWTVNLTSKDWLNKFNDIYGVSSPYNYHELPETTIEKLRDTDIKRGVEYSLIPSAATYINTNVPRLTLNDSAITQGVTRLSNAIQSKLNHNSNNRSSNSSWLTGLRYAPVVGSLINVVNDAIHPNNIDYSVADALGKISRDIRDVSATPIDTRIKYVPNDVMRGINELNALSGATNRGVLNTSAGNRGTATAGLLAADNNFMNNVGNTLFSAENSNYDRYLKARTLGMEGDKYNSELMLKAAMANQGADEVRARYKALSAEARQKALTAYDDRISLDWTNFFNNLGRVGEDAANRGDMRFLAQFFKGYNAATASKGGKLNRRRK